MKKNLIKKYLLIIILMSTSAESLMAAAPSSSTDMIITCAEPQVTERIKDKNKRIKTHTVVYWKVVVPQLEKSLPKSLLVKGVVLGDFHFNNLGIYFNFNEKVNKAELVLNDLDDAGTNYILGDLLKYFSFLRTDKLEVEGKGKKDDKIVTGKNLYDFDKIFDAYINGLRNKTHPMPSSFLKAMGTTESDAMEKYTKYMAKQLPDFGTMPKLESRLAATSSDLEKTPLISKNTILGRTYETNDSGSSAGQNRFTFLLQDPSAGNAKSIIEFKQLTCAASNLNRTQDLAQITKTVSTYLTTQNKSAQYDFKMVPNQSLVKSGKEVYLMRKKQVNFMEKVVEKAMEDGQHQEIAEMFAYLLGQFHSKNVSTAFIDQLANSSQVIFETCRQTQKIFLELTNAGK